MNFFGINLFLNKMDNLVNCIFEDIDLDKKRAYYAINPDCMLIAKDNPEYYNLLKDDKNIVYVDGKWIINTQKILNLPIAKERISTTDLFPRILELSEAYKRNTKIFLLGGKDGTPQKVVKNMNEKFKYPNFVGVHHGYFNKKQSEEVVKYINSCKPEILFVGFGCPIQELWVKTYINKINVNVVITCGGLFDYYSNNVKRAPQWMQELGLEWFFRFIQEPKRLFKRYIIGNLKYVFYLIYMKIRGEKYYKKKYEINNI